VAEALKAGAKAAGLRLSDYLRLLLEKDCSLEPRTRVQIPAGAPTTRVQFSFFRF